jgi:hypothetical protein
MMAKARNSMHALKDDRSVGAEHIQRPLKTVEDPQRPWPFIGEQSPRMQEYELFGKLAFRIEDRRLQGGQKSLIVHAHAPSRARAVTLSIVSAGEI